jgi:hypothetical protein
MVVLGPWLFGGVTGRWITRRLSNVAIIKAALSGYIWIKGDMEHME